MTCKKNIRLLKVMELRKQNLLVSAVVDTAAAWVPPADRVMTLTL